MLKKEVLMKKTKNRLLAYILAFAMLFGVLESGVAGVSHGKSNVKVADVAGEIKQTVSGDGAQTTEEPTPSPTPAPTAVPEKLITITPFSGQWKYYGQTRNFSMDIHYATSDDESLPEGVSLKVESESIGVHHFYVEDLRTDEEKHKVGYIIDATAPTYEIREYKTTAQVEAGEHIYNIADKLQYEDTVNAVSGSAGVISGSAVDTNSTMKQLVHAPAGYLISPTLEGDVEWKDSMEVELKEGDNTFQYYLCSNLKDNTRKAIDQTRKTITLKADWTTPEILSLSAGGSSTDISADGFVTSSEVGTFYYVVVPEEHAELTQSEIATNVGAHYGIVGYGRVDGTTKATEFSFSGLMANKNYILYAYMEDEAGNPSLVYRTLPFTTDLMALTGTVEVTGTMTVGEELVAKPNLQSVAPGELSYQWYRIKNKEDEADLDEIWDETGGAEEDDLEAEDDEEEDQEEDDDTVELSKLQKMADSGEDITTVDSATLIPDATKSTYKLTKADIGYRLICSVTAEKYSGYIAGESTSFVPKLLPEYTLPTISEITYSPKRKLSSFALPARWTWVDNTICPVYGNSGYRAKYVPENTDMYKSIIVRIKIPVKKRQITSGMIKLSKTKAYAGKPIKNNFSVKDGTAKLVLKKDFKVTYKNNKKPGKATITFKGIGNYKGTIKRTYQIKKRSVKNLSYSYSKTKVYNGKKRTAGVVVKNGNVRLSNKDYSITYKNNIEMGTATITILGTGYYYGKKVLHFSIIPAKPKVAKATKKGTTLKLNFKGNKLISGYNVYISTSSKFTKKKTLEYNLAGNKLQIKRMPKGKYYIRIKGYGVKKGKAYVSDYSAKKKVTIK